MSLANIQYNMHNINMKTQQVEIKNTRYYQLINRQYKYALYISSGSLKFTQERAFLVQPDQESLGQVWQIILIDPEGTKMKNVFQIVHARSTLVLTKTDKTEGVKLRFGKWDSTQLFYMQKVHSQNEQNIFRFVSYESNTSFLHFDKFLKVGVISPEQKKCHWFVCPCVQNPIINRSCYLQNAFTNLCIDVPEGSHKQGIELIQYAFNNRFNQRFNIYSEGPYFRIANINSKLFLTCSKKCREGDKITQESNSKSLQQQWKIQYQGRNLYIFRSVLNPQMMIGRVQKALKILSPLVTTKNQQYSLWKIVGFLPKKSEICFSENL